MRAGGLELRCSEVVAFRNAEGGVVGAQDAVDLLAEPRLVAKLEGDRRSTRGPERRCGQERGESNSVSLEIRRQLEEHEAKLTSLTDGLKRRKEVGDIIV